MGLVTALGRDLPAVWPRLLAGENGIAPISFFDASEYSCKVAAEVRYLPPNEIGIGEREETGLDSIPTDYCRRSTQFFLRVAREAYIDSGLDRSGIRPDQVGVASGISVNYLHMKLLKHYFRFRNADSTRLDLLRFAKEGIQPVSTFYRRLGDITPATPAKALNLKGPNISLDAACAASAYAIGEAFRVIRRGKAQAMVAGGASALVTPISILAFSLLGALSRNRDPEQASRPFDRKRDGFVMGEGGGAVVLEDREHAEARGARIYGELLGYGTTMNAYNLTDPSPDGSCEEKAMRLALEEASLQPEEIGYIAAHGTSTPKNDVTETAAIKRLFGSHAKRLLVSSNKGQIGHTISAAGVCNLIFAVKAINDGHVPPTVHYSNPDPRCDLDYVPNTSRPAKIRAALANAFAFGGQNAVLAVGAVT